MSDGFRRGCEMRAGYRRPKYQPRAGKKSWDGMPNENIKNRSLFGRENRFQFSCLRAKLLLMHLNDANES